MTTLRIIVALVLLGLASTLEWNEEKETLLKLLTNQVMAQQLQASERVRSEGHSGIKQVCHRCISIFNMKTISY